MARTVRPDGGRHGSGMLYLTQDMSAILAEAESETKDRSLSKSIYFSPTALTFVRRMLENGGTIITDTMLISNGIDRTVLKGRNVQVRCFIDEPRVTELAEQRKVTRAEVAADFALSEPGMKLMVYGSAPAGIQRVMNRRAVEPLNEVCILAGATGFAGSIQLKERLVEGEITSIVLRGKKGGIPTTIALANAILHQIAGNMK